MDGAGYVATASESFQTQAPGRGLPTSSHSSKSCDGLTEQFASKPSVAAGEPELASSRDHHKMADRPPCLTPKGCTVNVARKHGL